MVAYPLPNIFDMAHKMLQDNAVALFNSEYFNYAIIWFLCTFFLTISLGITVGKFIGMVSIALLFVAGFVWVILKLLGIKQEDARNAPGVLETWGFLVSMVILLVLAYLAKNQKLAASGIAFGLAVLFFFVCLIYITRDHLNVDPLGLRNPKTNEVDKLTRFNYTIALYSCVLFALSTISAIVSPDHAIVFTAISIYAILGGFIGILYSPENNYLYMGIAFLTIVFVWWSAFKYGNVNMAGHVAFSSALLSVTVATTYVLSGNVNVVLFSALGFALILWGTLSYLKVLNGKMHTVFAIITFVLAVYIYSRYNVLPTVDILTLVDNASNKLNDAIDILAKEEIKEEKKEENSLVMFFFLCLLGVALYVYVTPDQNVLNAFSLPQALEPLKTASEKMYNNVHQKASDVRQKALDKLEPMKDASNRMLKNLKSKAQRTLALPEAS